MATGDLSSPDEGRLRELFMNAPWGYFRSTLAGKLVGVNPRAAEMLGYSSPRDLMETVNQQAMGEVLFADFSQREQMVAGLLEREQWAANQVTLRRKDGTLIVGNIHSRAFTNPDRSVEFEGFVDDVTDRVRAQEELAESEAQLKAVLLNSRDAIGVHAEGLWQLCNLAAMRLFGVESENDLVGTPVLECIAAEDRTRVQGFIRDRSHGADAPMEYVTRGLRRDGSTFDMEVTASTYPFRGKLHVLVTLRDITDRLKAEQDRRAAAEALQASEARFRAVVENSYDGIIFADAEARILYRSPSFVQLSGYPDSESVGHIGFAMVHPDDLQRVQDQWRVMVRDAPGRFQIRYRIRHKDGSWRWLETSVQNMLGNPILACVLITSRDITDRVRAEEELAAAMDRYRSLVELSPDAVLVHRESRVAFANAAAATLFGVSSPADLVGTGIEAMVHPDYRALVQQRSYRIQQLAEAVPRLEQKCLRRDGSAFDVDVSSAPITWDGVRSSLTIIRDISERKRTEQALTESEGNLRHALAEARRRARELELLDEVRKSVQQELDVPVIFQAVVDSVVRALGYGHVSIYMAGPEGTLNLRCQRGYTRVLEHIPAAAGVCGRTFRSGTAALVRDVRQDPDFVGAIEGIMSEICIPLMDQGRPVGVLNVETTDETPLTAADLGLLEAVGEHVNIALSKARLYADAEASARRYSNLVARLGEGIAIVDMEECFEFANKAAEDVFGVAAGGLIGRTLKEFLDPPALRKVAEETERRRHGETGTYEIAIRRQDGSARQIEVLAAPHRADDGQIHGALVVFRDVSDMRRMEQERARLQAQLQQAQKMEAVGRLAGGVAHDFNNLLQVIVGYGEVALESLAPEASPARELQQILHAARRSGELTRQLLAFARKQDVVPRILDLNQTISRTLKMLQRLIGEDIQLVWKPSPGVWPAELDPSQVDQILTNLAANARDAIQGVGSVTVATANVTLGEEWCQAHAACIAGDYVMVSVTDTGIGMSTDVLDHVFEPFFTTKGVGRGTGLGLATVYGIVKQNEGFVDVQSQPGKGTTFCLYFPRKEGPVPESGVQDSGTSPGGSESILVVEDDQSILGLVQGILARLGYRVLVARTPSIALSVAGEHAGRLDLLVTDVVMPEMNGRDLNQRLRKLHPEMKTLYMSGYTADVISQRGAIEEGASFIQKPFSTTSIASRVRQILDAAEGTDGFRPTP